MDIFESAFVKWGCVAVGTALVVGSIFILVTVWLTLRRRYAVSRDFIAKYRAFLEKKHYKQLFDYCAADPTVLAQALSAGMRYLQYSRDEGRENAKEEISRWTRHRERLIAYLPAIATLGSMLGLGAGTSNKIATDSSFAAIAIALGVVLCLIGVLASVFLRNKAHRHKDDLVRTVDDLLLQLYHSTLAGKQELPKHRFSEQRLREDVRVQRLLKNGNCKDAAEAAIAYFARSVDCPVDSWKKSSTWQQIQAVF